MKLSAFLSLAFIVLGLPACSMGLAETGAASYVAITGTRPDEPPPADTADQIAQHESWCYETMGYPECYPHAQATDPNRLINVDPENRYPLTPQAYKDAVNESP